MKCISIGAVNVTLLTDGPTGREVMVMDDIRYCFNRWLGFSVTVPKGFVSDLTTVPRILWRLIPPHGRYRAAAILHDYLYKEQKPLRRTVDEIFNVVMKRLGVGYWQRWLLYAGVRIGGWWAWRKHKLSKERN